MVQKGEKRPRGRPRTYDPAVALRRAMEAFWDAGFSGTSLDDLSDRTGLNRPSLYAAFGDKQALYLKTLEGYLEERRTLIAGALESGRPFPETLRTLFRFMIDRFLEGDRGARGCYLVGTAATQAVTDPEVRRLLETSLRELDHRFGEAFAAAQASGELGSDTDPVDLAVVATALVYTLALRARSGQSRAVLRKVADSTLSSIFSSAGRKAKK